MSDLPKDPFILLSFVNTQLRDRYASLEALCDDLDADQDALRALLSSIGYTYDAHLNKFI